MLEMLFLNVSIYPAIDISKESIKISLNFFVFDIRKNTFSVMNKQGKNHKGVLFILFNSKPFATTNILINSYLFTNVSKSDNLNKILVTIYENIKKVVYGINSVFNLFFI
jgi:hypothetical protein